MIRLQAALPTSALPVLAVHSPRSAGVAARAGIASSRATQKSSPFDPRAVMLFSSALGSDGTPAGAVILAPTADILPSSTGPEMGQKAAPSWAAAVSSSRGAPRR